MAQFLKISTPSPKWVSLVAQTIKNPPTKAEDPRDTCFIPGLGRSPEGGNGNPFQDSCLENPKDRGPWWATVPGVTDSDTIKTT